MAKQQRVRRRAQSKTQKISRDVQGKTRIKNCIAQQPISHETAPCNALLLPPSNSYGVPDFVERGYYTDIAFKCADCDKEEIWSATQQKWWYEVAKGYVYSAARRCRNCRRKERERKSEARRAHLEGVKRKQSSRAN